MSVCEYAPTLIHRPEVLRLSLLFTFSQSLTVAGEGNDTTQSQAHLKLCGSAININIINIIHININISDAPCEDPGMLRRFNSLL